MYADQARGGFGGEWGGIYGSPMECLGMSSTQAPPDPQNIKRFSHTDLDQPPKGLLNQEVGIQEEQPP